MWSPWWQQSCQTLSKLKTLSTRETKTTVLYNDTGSQWYLPASETIQNEMQSQSESNIREPGGKLKQGQKPTRCEM